MYPEELKKKVDRAEKKLRPFLEEMDKVIGEKIKKKNWNPNWDKSAYQTYPKELKRRVDMAAKKLEPLLKKMDAGIGRHMKEGKPITYLGYRGALGFAMKTDKDYVFVRHELKPKQSIPLHYHEKANEWLIADHGKFIVTIDDKKETFDLSYDGTATIIHFPAGSKHSLRALSNMEYFVIRDQDDKIIYCKSKKKKTKT